MTIQPIDLEAYLHEQIPLSGEMGVSVRELQLHAVTLTAPLRPNVNHRETVFGGSASALGILAAWAMVWLQMKSCDDLETSIVIQRSQMEYQKPIHTDFEATCLTPDPPAWAQLKKTLYRKGLGRISLESKLYCEGQVVGLFNGTFVVFDMKRQG
jgi:thioesterase domain-containing protein